MTASTTSGCSSEKPGVSASDIVRRSRSGSVSFGTWRVTSANVSGGMFFEFGPPGSVQERTSASTRVGAIPASDWAIAPPIEAPSTAAVSTRSASRTERMSRANSGAEYGPERGELPPTPRLSTRIRRNRSSSAGDWPRHIHSPYPSPSTSTRGRPRPRTS